MMQKEESDQQRKIRGDWCMVSPAGSVLEER